MIIKQTDIFNSNRFNRLKHSMINIKPNKPIQLVIGGNGAGKSTLLSYLLPYSPNKKDYSSNGYRKVKYTINNKTIIIHNTYKTNSFLLDGKELNIGNTLTVQNQLIEQHFGLTKDIMSLITGTLSFSSLPDSKRAYYIQLLSKTDYSIAMKIFETLKVKHRDVKGVIKHYQSLLSSITVDEDLLRVKERELQLLSNKLETLYKNKPNYNKVTTTVEYLNELQRELEELEGLCGEVNESVLDMNTQSISIIEDKLKRQQQQSTQTPEQIQEETLHLKELINQLEYKEVKDMVNIPNLDISEHITTIVESGIKNINDAHILHERFNRLSSEYKRIHQEIHRLERAMNITSTTCPECKTDFIPTENPVTLTRLQIELNNNKLMLRDIQEEVDGLEEHSISYLNVVKAVDLIFDTLYPYKEYIQVTKDNIVTDPLNIQEQLNELISSTSMNNKQLEINKQLTEYKHRLELLKTKQVTNYVYESKEELDALLNEHRLAIKHYEDNIERVNRFKRLQEIYVIESKQLPLIEENNKLKELNTSRDEQLKLTKIEYSKQNAEILKLRADLTVQMNTQTKLDEQKIKLDELTKLIDGISPKTGLIGTAIKSTVDDILSKINEFISNIWSEDMVLKRKENNPYQFEVIRDGQTTDDIKLGSSGMKSVIDVAFRIVALKLLGFQDIFILDEFGSDLDTTHRAKAMELIERLPTLGFKQIWVVSHFVDGTYKLSEQTELIQL